MTSDESIWSDGNSENEGSCNAETIYAESQQETVQVTYRRIES